MGRLFGKAVAGEAAVTLGRPSGSGPEYVTFRVDDRVSGIEFLELRMKLDDFARMLTGLAYNDAEMVTRGLENIGKVREYENAQVFISDKDYNKATAGDYYAREKELAKWLNEHHARDGWIIDDYLGSQGSVGYATGGKLLNFGYFRYVDKT
jgi:hypothetical protein